MRFQDETFSDAALEEEDLADPNQSPSITASQGGKLFAWPGFAPKTAWRQGAVSCVTLFHQAWELAADLVYPPSCICCRKATQSSQALCSECWGLVRFIERPFCERLGIPFETDPGIEGALSPEAMKDPPVFGRARAVAQFEDGPVRQMIHRLKYNDRLDLAKPMGRWMSRAGAELLESADVIVPIPLHWRRLVKRRFNQANALAQVISRESGIALDPFSLKRVKPSPSQVGLSRSQRALNVQAAFRVADGAEIAVKDRSILLIDDVMTTGATLSTAARALLRAGAANVDVLVFARVV